MLIRIMAPFVIVIGQEPNRRPYATKSRHPRLLIYLKVVMLRIRKDNSKKNEARYPIHSIYDIPNISMIN